MCSKDLPKEPSTNKDEVDPGPGPGAEEKPVEDKSSSLEVSSPTTTSKCDILSCCGTRPIQSGEELAVWDSSLEDQANILSSWFLTYLTPLLRLGSSKVLDANDMGVPSAQDRADRAYDIAKQAFEVQSIKAHAINEKLKAKHEAALAKCKTEKERQKVKPLELKDPSIALALVKGFGTWTIVVGIIYYIISALLGFVPVLILNDLVTYFETGRSAVNPWIEVAGLAVVPLIISLLQTRHQTIMAHCAVFVRTAVSTLLYRKALRVSAAGRAQTSTGQVVNMMSNDTAQLQRFLQFGGMTLVAPIQIIVALVLIYQQVRRTPLEQNRILGRVSISILC